MVCMWGYIGGWGLMGVGRYMCGVVVCVCCIWCGVGRWCVYGGMCWGWGLIDVGTCVVWQCVCVVYAVGWGGGVYVGVCVWAGS